MRPRCAAGSAAAAPRSTSARRRLVGSWCSLWLSGFVGKRAAAFQQTLVSQVRRTGGKCLGRAAPFERVHIPEQRRVGPECRQLLEQQRLVAVFSQDGRREILYDAVAVEEPCRRDRADAG